MKRCEGRKGWFPALGSRLLEPSLLRQIQAAGEVCFPGGARQAGLFLSASP